MGYSIADGVVPYAVSSWLFLRLLGIVHLIAFVSLWVQVTGLFGSRGIVPATSFLSALRAHFGHKRFVQAPTLFWMSSSDLSLHLGCGIGTVGSILVVLDILPAPILLVLAGLYLSFIVVGQEFMAFQWDALLVETSVLAALLAPWHLWPHSGHPVPQLGLFLLWWLLFRLVFQSGVGKLTSGDTTWRNLTALEYHYFTQPLPTSPAWLAHQLPTWFHKISVIATLVLEIAVPLLIFGTRNMRLVAFVGLVGLQILIVMTGNYNFFNLLTMALALLLLDDGVWVAVLPASLAPTLAAPQGAALPGPGMIALALVIVGVSGLKLARTFSPNARLPGPLQRVLALLDPFRVINGYGLFRVMTTRRLEISLQGSEDGRAWVPFAFRYKPGDPLRRPRFCAPHQPRLDWQMWFAALRRYEDSPWLESLLSRLLEGSGPVRRLLAPSPFSDHPPRFVRAVWYDYRFSDWKERRETAAWWVRRTIGRYGPTLTLKSRIAN